MAASSRSRILIAFVLILALTAIALQGLRIYNVERQHALSGGMGTAGP